MASYFKLYFLLCIFQAFRWFKFRSRLSMGFSHGGKLDSFKGVQTPKSPPTSGSPTRVNLERETGKTQCKSHLSWVIKKGVCKDSSESSPHTTRRGWATGTQTPLWFSEDKRTPILYPVPYLRQLVTNVSTRLYRCVDVLSRKHHVLL